MTENSTLGTVSDDWFTVLTNEGTQYVCPGETQPISRSVHLARMAAFYPKCRDCALRGDTGQLPRRTVARLETASKRVPRTSLAAEDGLRGVYLNEMTRPRAERIAERFAVRLWDRQPRELRIPTDDLEPTPPVGPRRPRVVVGRDDRTNSPEIAAGVIAALVRCGCEVVDVHTVTRPALWFAVDHLDAVGGVHVTGCGTPASWTGLDFLEDGLPIVETDDLDRLDDPRPAPRPTRGGGSRRSFRAVVPYEAGLWRHFHALRPLRIVIGCGSKLLRGTFERLFEKLPCRVTFGTLAVRAREVRDPRDADVRLVADEVRRTGADLGAVVDEDGQRTAFVDERCHLVESTSLRSLVSAIVADEHPGTGLNDPLPSPAHAVLRMRDDPELRYVDTLDGRSWFRDTAPTSDAALLLARVLAALSRGDVPFSEVLARRSTAA